MILVLKSVLLVWVGCFRIAFFVPGKKKFPFLRILQKTQSRIACHKKNSFENPDRARPRLSPVLIELSQAFLCIFRPPGPPNPNVGQKKRKIFSHFQHWDGRAGGPKKPWDNSVSTGGRSASPTQRSPFFSFTYFLRPLNVRVGLFFPPFPVLD